MKFPLSWLKRHLATDADAPQIADTLTRIGLEVEDVQNPADALAPFVIARVLTARPHPDSDHLQVLTVDPKGDGTALQVVCGAPNARAGLVGVFAPPGTWVPGIDTTLKVAKIRGVESNGMMCSARELETGTDHAGIIELPADAPIGAPYAPWAGLDDPVFDIAITPNRQDCMSVFGIARDLAAAGLGTLTPAPAPAIAADASLAVTVATDTPAACPAFLARRVAGVADGPSPAWLVALLDKAGIHPVSALVDVTNYVSHAFGQPLHAYDAAKLDGDLRARFAQDGEEILALNGKSYALAPDMLVIADAARPRSIAGIMGGEDSAVGPETQNIVLEAAWFAPAGIGATGRTLGLTTDARQRFERGVDPAFTAQALDIATAMILDLCGGTAGPVHTAGALPVPQRSVSFDPAFTERLGGIAIPAAEQKAILARLGFGVTGAAPFTVAVPGWRRDIDGPADLVEEVVRIHGIDRVQSVPLPRADGVARPTATPEQLRERRLKRLLAARGLNETVNWSFISADSAALVQDDVRAIENPLSLELAVMRPSLLPGLAQAAARNLARGQQSVRLFESGRRYLPDGEHPTIAVLMAGAAHPADWRLGAAAPADVFALKERLFEALAMAGLPADRLQIRTDTPSRIYHPGRSAVVALGKARLAEFGELHPRFAAALGLDGRTVAGEIFLDAIPLPRVRRTRGAFQPSPLQPVRRDFAFFVPQETAAGDLIQAIRRADKDLIADVRLFDRFAGAGVPEGQVSLALTVTLQPGTKTLTDRELHALGERIVAAASKFGATIRDGSAS